jgi:REP element-mobilizing transposase RayT
MDEYQSLSHTKWDCKYHVVFIPKRRRKTIYAQPRQHFGEVFRRPAAQRESKIEEGHLMRDHVHMMISIPPKYSVSEAVGTSGARAPSIWRKCTENGSTVLRAAFLGTRILRVRGRSRGGSDPRIHSEPGGGRRTTRQLKLEY